MTGFLSSCLQLSTLNQNPQSCRDQTLCNSPFLLPSNLIHAGNSTTWRKDRKMEKEKTLLTNNHFSLKNLKVREEGGGGGELSILNSRIVMMMCCCRLSPLPHGDDVLGIVWTCLPVAILSLCFGLQKLSLSFSGADYRNSARGRRIKTSSRVTGPCPMQSLCGQRWKIIPHPENHRGFCCCPSCGQKSEKQARNARGLGHG